MSERRKKHTFVICAYKESQYLEECIQSLKKQTYKSEIIMVTSTPNTFIEEMAKKYEIELFVNEGQGGIVQDWNFGYSKVQTEYLTIAHQDDVYFEDYAKEAVERLESSKKPLIYFTDYYELRDGNYEKENRLLNVKRVLLKPMKIKALSGSRIVRRRILSLGCAICCPSVSFCRGNLPKQVFTVGYRSCEDWQAWEKLSRLKGDFLYNSKPLMAHRIHEESETSAIIGDNARTQEDLEMLMKFWPKWFAKILVKKYSTSQDSNNI